MPFTIVRADITTLNTDAIVNAANTDLIEGGGVCGAIFKAAGRMKMRDACARLAPVPTGDAVMTPGFDLAARHVIHAVGPVYQDGQSGEEALLRSAYKKALTLASEQGLKSIAFPLISSGIYGYPKAAALAVASSAIRAFLAAHDLDVKLVIFDNAAFELNPDLLGRVEAYIDQHFADRQPARRRAKRTDVPDSDIMRAAAPQVIETNVFSPMLAKDAFDALDDSFSVFLFKLIDRYGYDEVEVYKRANLDRKLFSKIRSNPAYAPSKRTAVALAVALELGPDEAMDLLGRAGYAFSKSRLEDVIAMYFIERGLYDLFAINEVLFHYDRPLLGA